MIYTSSLSGFQERHGNSILTIRRIFFITQQINYGQGNARPRWYLFSSSCTRVMDTISRIFIDVTFSFILSAKPIINLVLTLTRNILYIHVPTLSFSFSLSIIALLMCFLKNLLGILPASYEKEIVFSSRNANFLVVEWRLIFIVYISFRGNGDISAKFFDLCLAFLFPRIIFLMTGCTMYIR